MPRGKKLVSIDERIEITKLEIENNEVKLKELKSNLKSLQEEKQKSDLNELYDLISKSGKSIDDVINWLSEE